MNTPDNNQIYTDADLIKDLKRENTEFRIMLAVTYAGASLYADDGELQDSTRGPLIDWKRDSIDEIKEKLKMRFFEFSGI